MKIFMLIIMFLCIGALFIVSQNNLALGNPKNVDNFVSLYGNWLKGSVENLGSLTSHVVKMEWLP